MSEDVTITGALLAQDVVESFVLAGWLSHWALAAIALAALVILAALALLERRRGEPWWKLLLLYVCRGVAVVVVIWMLAQPAILSVITHRHPKSVAVLVDTSQSMSVSDAPTGAHTAQWALVRNGDQAGRPGTQADAALVALQLCRQQFARFSQAVTTATEHEQARTSAAQALDHARFAGDAMRRCGDRRTSLPSESVKRSRTLLERIEGELVSAVDRMVEDHTSGKLQLGGDLHARLNAIAQTIGQLIGEVRDLSEAIVEYERSDMDAALFDQPVYRMEAAADMTRRVAEQIRGGQADAAVLAFEFAREAKAIEPDTLTGLPPDQRQPEAQATDLAAALEHVAASTAQRRTAAVIMISDGGHNAAEDPLKTAAGLSDLPVYVLPVGNPRHVREVVVHQAKAPRTVFRNDDVAIEALVDAYASAGETLEVQLLQGDNVVDRDEVMISSDTFLHRVQFRQEALEIGRHEYVIRATPLTDERVTSNNAAQVAVDVIEQDIAVLLADRFARWEHRYLRNLLKRDERTEYDEVLFEPPPVRGRSDRAAGLPDTLEQWSRYRVVILGDLAPEHLSQKQQEQLEQYVGEQGGAIVLIAGRDAMPGAFADQPLRPMVPVDLDRPAVVDDAGYRVKLTVEGELLSAMQLGGRDPEATQRVWDEATDASPIFTVSPFSLPRATSRVLLSATAAGDERAFVCWQPYGRGRVVYIAAPATYRLRYRHGDRYHYRFWAQLLRWVIAGQMDEGSRTVRLSTDKAHYNRGEPVQVTVRLRDLRGEPVAAAALSVAVFDRDNVVAESPMREDEKAGGVYRAVFESLESGLYQIKPVGDDVETLLQLEQVEQRPGVTVNVEPHPSIELRDTRCNLPLLTRIGEATGGCIVPPTATAALIDQLDLNPDITEQRSMRPLWTRWSLLWVFTACLCIEWCVRKLTGMA